MKPNIMVAGANGQLGTMLQNIAPDYNAHWRFPAEAELDITSPESINSALEQFKPTHCINCAAYTAVDKAESDQKTTFLINQTGAANLAKACTEIGTKLLHVSTDFVYSGEKNFYYLESDEANPINQYGASKLAGEKEITAISTHYIILRTSWLYSEFGNNFVKTMMRLGAEKEEVSVVFDQIGTPTYARDLAELLARLCTEDSLQNIEGIYHFSNEGVASWYDFAHEVFRLANLPARLFPVDSGKFPTPAQRPTFSVMGKQKIKEHTGMPIRHWKDALADCMNRMTKK